MEGDLLGLQWTEHSKVFSHAIGSLRAKNAYTDATLACDGKFYPVHKFVLSTCSDYLSAIFEWTPCVNPVVVINNVSCKELEALLDFMYIGEVSLREGQVPGVMRAAEWLRVKGLALLDEEAIRNQMSGKPSSEFESPAKKRKRRDSRKNVPNTTGLHLPPPTPPPPPPPPSQPPLMPQVPRPTMHSGVSPTTSNHQFAVDQTLRSAVDTQHNGAQHQQQPQHHQLVHQPHHQQPRPQHPQHPTHHHQHQPDHQQHPRHQLAQVHPATPRAPLAAHHHAMHSTNLASVQNAATPNAIRGNIQSPPNPPAAIVVQSSHLPPSQPSPMQASPQSILQSTPQPSPSPQAQNYKTHIPQPVPAHTPPTQFPGATHIAVPEPMAGNDMSIPIDKLIQAVKLEMNAAKEELEDRPEDTSVGIPELLNLVEMGPMYDNKTEQEEGTSQNSDPPTAATSAVKPEKSSPGEFKCTVCGKIFPKKDSLTRHMKIHSKPPYKCPNCEFTASNQKELTQHKKESHSMHKCPQCDFTTDRKDIVKRHMMVHSDNLFKCPHCDYSAKRSQYLSKHINNMHKKK